MENRENQSPASGQETDLSKAQNQQQPFGQPPQQGQQGQSEFAMSQQQPPEGQSQQQTPQGQADYGSAGQSDTTTQQRSDIEGGTATGQASDAEGSPQFVGAQGATDTSSELIEDDDDDFTKPRGDRE